MVPGRHHPCCAQQHCAAQHALPHLQGVQVAGPAVLPLRGVPRRGGRRCLGRRAAACAGGDVRRWRGRAPPHGSSTPAAAAPPLPHQVTERRALAAPRRTWLARVHVLGAEPDAAIAHAVPALVLARVLVAGELPSQAKLHVAAQRKGRSRGSRGLTRSQQSNGAGGAAALSRDKGRGMRGG